MTIQYRQARPDDAPGIAQVHVSSWRAAYAGIVPAHVLDTRSVEEQQAFWSKVLELKPESIIVAESDLGEIVGWVSFGANRESPDIGEIFAIYNRPDYFRCGVGTALWGRARQCLHEAGFQAVMLLVIIDALAARHFYESVGFKLIEGSDSTFEWGGETIADVRYEYHFDKQ